VVSSRECSDEHSGSGAMELADIYLEKHFVLVTCFCELFNLLTQQYKFSWQL
jgi:hypothetical protein